MAIEVFNRYEKKYLVPIEKAGALIKAMSFRMEPDAFNVGGETYKITNIYYDTADSALIRTSVEKPVYKEKFRLRAYGVPNLTDQVFLEIKKKYNGNVNKRRTTMPLIQAYQYLNQGLRPVSEQTESLVGEQAGGQVLKQASARKINWQVLKEIDYMKSLYGLVPKAYISYDRMAYFDREDKNFRVTFDTNIQTRRNHLRLEDGAYGEQLLNKGMMLMEVKIPGAMPLWFNHYLTELEIYPTSFSKYGMEYKRFLAKEAQEQKRKGELLCWNPSLQVQAHLA